MKRRYQNIHERFSSFWWGERGPSALLVLLLLTIMLAPLMGSALGKLLKSLFFSMVLLSGVATMSDKLLPRLGVGILALIAFVLTWCKHFNSDNELLQASSTLITLCYLLLLTGVLMRHVFQEGPVTTSRVQGAIAAYILIGLTWATIYRLLELQLPGSIFVSPTAIGRIAHDRESELTYFSFVTLTTLGYGDITPVHPTARMFVIIEALIGQLFPATLLARLVSLQTLRREPDNDP